jgi:hypothetical protein
MDDTASASPVGVTLDASRRTWLALTGGRAHGEGVSEHSPRREPASPTPDVHLLPDVNGSPSAYSLAQVTAERKGITLHPDATLEQCHQLQQHATQLRQRELDLRTMHRARRVTLLAITTVALWLFALIALLDQQ